MLVDIICNHISERIESNPPVPIRDFDWSAWDDETYDKDSVIGHGKTEEEAINDLIEQTEDNQ